MKRNIYIVLLAAAPVIGSCNKSVLSTSPNNQIASSTMWTTDNLTDLGVAGVYNVLRTGGGSQGTGGDMLYELYSLDRYGLTGQSAHAASYELTAATATPGSGLFSTAWSALYEGVARANDAITNIPALSPSVATKKARYVAECKFLRAYFYFRLNQLWQGVPVYLKPTATNAFTAPVSPTDSVWQVCINDLTDAINEPNLPAIYAAGNANYGHATKGAAYALRGEIYMYLKQYANAVADFQQVQASGYALYTGSGALSYKMLFKAVNNQCAEMIFAMQNEDLTVGGVSMGGVTEFYCGTRVSVGSCWDTYGPSNSLVDLYENADGSAFNWDAYLPGYNEMSPAAREVFFLRDSCTAAELNAAAARGADVSQYLPGGNEARIAAVYANRDPRLSMTVITPYAQYLGSVAGAGGDLEYTLRWPYRNSNAPVQDVKSDNTTNGYYFWRKFVYEGSSEGVNRASTSINQPIIRYADILLRWAECLNEEGGPSAQALALINQVRERAGQPDLQCLTPACQLLWRLRVICVKGFTTNGGWSSPMKGLTILMNYAGVRGRLPFLRQRQLTL